MNGQMKTLLDRINPLYSSDYNFRRVYLLSCAADEDAATPEKAVNGLQGWMDCFEKAELTDSIFFGGINAPAEAAKKDEALNAAFEFGKMLL